MSLFFNSWKTNAVQLVQILMNFFGECNVEIYKLPKSKFLLGSRLESDQNSNRIER